MALPCWGDFSLLSYLLPTKIMECFVFFVIWNPFKCIMLSTQKEKKGCLRMMGSCLCFQTALTRQNHKAGVASAMSNTETVADSLGRGGVISRDELLVVLGGVMMEASRGIIRTEAEEALGILTGHNHVVC